MLRCDLAERGVVLPDGVCRPEPRDVSLFLCARAACSPPPGLDLVVVVCPQSTIERWRGWRQELLLLGIDERSDVGYHMPAAALGTVPDDVPNGVIHPSFIRAAIMFSAAECPTAAP